MNNTPVFIDTSALYALADNSDVHHDESVAVVSYLKKNKSRVFTTNYILVEAHTLILGRLGHYVSRKWLAGFAIPLEHSYPSDLKKAKEIIFNWQDKTFSLTDAISFVVMERCKSSFVFAFDQHFFQYGFQLINNVQ